MTATTIEATTGLTTVKDACHKWDGATDKSEEFRGAFADSVYLFEIDERIGSTTKHEDIVEFLGSSRIQSTTVYREAIALGMVRTIADDLDIELLPTSFVAGRILKSGLKNAEGKAYKLTNVAAFEELAKNPDLHGRIRLFADIMAEGEVTDEGEAARMAIEDPENPKPEKTEGETIRAKLKTFINALGKSEDTDLIAEIIGEARKELTAAAKATK